MSREVVIAAVQLPSFPSGDSNPQKRESNFQAAETWLDEAGRRGADIACLGEHFNSIGQEISADNLRTEIWGVKEEAIERIGAVAKRYHMYAIAPVWGLLGNTPRNVALVIDRGGSFLGAYCKVHPTMMERELGIVAGDEWPVFELDFGRIGIQTCHDNSFPESARCLTLNGAEVIFWPHVMSGWGGEFMDILLRSPAIHNGVHHIPVCFGSDPRYAWRPGMMIGRSSVIAPDGTITADAGRFPGIALAWVDLDAPRIAHDFTRSGDYVWRADMLRERRPDTYQMIVSRLP
jgi:predicted amidohydrolase